MEATVIGPGTLSFWWQVSGDAFWSSLSFQLDNTTQANISGELTWQPLTVYIGAGTHTLEWIYARKVFGGSGSETGWLDQVNFAGGSTPAFLTNSPISQTVPAGTNVTFTAVAVGTPPLIYQWQFNGTNINGATNPSLAFLDAQAVNQGGYTLVVTNDYGSAISTNAMLVVVPGAPVILAQPANLTAVPSGNAFVQITVQGSEPLNYQWSFNGTNIVGATNSSLILSGFQPAEAGSYTLAVSNAYGGVLSSNINVTLQPTAVVAWGYNCCGQTDVPMGLTNPVGIAGGFYHSLALQSDGTVVAWGQNGSGQCQIPQGLTNVAAIAAGGYASLALRSDGTIVVWGNFGYPNPSPPSNAVAIAGGWLYSLALENDGTVVAWGPDTPATPSGLGYVVAIAANIFHMLALKSDGTVVAWDNGDSQTNVPAGLTNVVAIAACTYDSLALLQNGTVVAWGLNLDGETNVPPGLSNVVAIAGGETFCVALKSDGSLVTWGKNSQGQTNIPVGLTNVIAITSGGQHSLALLNDGSPQFTWQPRGAMMHAGDAIVLGVGAVGAGPLSYQWQFNGTNLAGATGTSIVLTNVQLANAGSYSVGVSNAHGSVISANAVIAVAPPPEPFEISLFGLGLNRQGFNLRLEGLSGMGEVVIYASSDLVTWQPIFTNPPSLNPMIFLDPSATNLPKRFYRSIEQ